jgi:hypothetical protein
VYWFGVAYLRFRTSLDVPDAILAGWQAAVYAGPALVVLGGVLLLPRWLLQDQAAKGAGIAIASLAMLLLPMAYMFEHALFFTCFAARAEGRIVALHDAGRGTVAPVVEYRAAGCTYTVRPHHERTQCSAPEYVVGDPLPVLYRNDVPAAAVVGTFSELWGFVLFATGGATLLLVMLTATRLERRSSGSTLEYRFVVFAQTRSADGP